MTKYIVKNCPAYNPKYCDCKNTKEIACLYRTDCLIKQVIEKCRKYGVTYLGDEILQLFEIEECDNDN